MIDIAFYLVTREIAKRCNLVSERYCTKDGRFVLDNKDLSRMRLTSEEFVNGIEGIELVTEQEAKRAIEENGSQFDKEEEEDNEAIVNDNEEMEV